MKISEYKDAKPLDKPTPTVSEIAAKHKVSSEYIRKQLAIGTKVEMEHTTDRKVAKEIALDHIAEFADYYERLKKAEA